MTKLIRIIAVIWLFPLLMAGCGGTKMAVRPDMTARLNTIALIRVSEPAAYVAQDFGNPGMMFGAVGGAVAGSSSANAGKSVNQIVVDSQYAAGEDFTRQLQKRLTGMGYRVEVVTVERDDIHKLLQDYAAVDSGGSDAVLDVAIESIGYATEHPMFSPFWRPASQVRVALVDSRSGEKLYAEKFMYGYHNPLMSGTDIDAPDTYHFKDKEALFADDGKLVAGIQDSVKSVVEAVGENLKR